MLFSMYCADIRQTIDLYEQCQSFHIWLFFILSKTRKYPNMIEQKQSLAGHGGCGWIVNHMAVQPGSTMIAGINTSYKNV